MVFTGALSLSRWESMSSLGSGSSTGGPRTEQRQLGMSHDSGITTNGSGKYIFFWLLICDMKFRRFASLVKQNAL